MRPPKPRAAPAAAAAAAAAASKLPRKGLLPGADMAMFQEWFRGLGQQQDQQWQQQGASRNVWGLDLGGPTSVPQAPAVGSAAAQQQQQQHLAALSLLAAQAAGPKAGFMAAASSLGAYPWSAAMPAVAQEGQAPDAGTDPAAAVAGHGNAMAAAPGLPQALAQLLPAGQSTANAAQELLAAAAADQELDGDKCRMLQALAAKAALEKQAAKAAAAGAAGGRAAGDQAAMSPQDALALRWAGGKARLSLDLS